jgi:glycosyltransferase involved in cell wall biosynthesis
MLPARDEAPRIGAVLERVPAGVDVIVVDDGSTDGTGEVAAAAGAVVVRTPGLGLGAAVRIGLREAVARGADVVAFCDADGEYDPAEIDRLVAPIAAGDADYVVGSRFAGHIHAMHPHRRAGNLALTGAMRLLTRRRITDGQSGYRALSREAASAAEIDHDFNYAQVLTLELLRKGFRYAEVPITYRFRSSGDSFVKLVPYLRRVVPAVWRELARRRLLGADDRTLHGRVLQEAIEVGRPPQSSTTWAANRALADAHAPASQVPSGRRHDAAASPSASAWWVLSWANRPPRPKEMSVGRVESHDSSSRTPSSNRWS